MVQRPDHSSRLAIGVDLGGTQITTILANPQGKVVERLQRETPTRGGPNEIVHAIETEIKSLLDKEITERSTLLGVGIACPGSIDIHRQIITTSPNLSGFSYFPLVEKLSSKLQTKIRIGNDLTLAGLGEHRFGAGKGISNMIFVGVGTGIGGGIIIDNKVYHGKSGSAGEIGHIIIQPNGPKCGCGNKGCLEAIASGNGLKKLARKRIDAGENSILADLITHPAKWKESGNLLSSKAIFDGAKTGDILAKSIVSGGVTALGTALAILVNLFNPQMIVIGGGLANQWEMYIKPAIERMNQLAFPQPKEDATVVPSSLQGLAGALGAMTLLEN